MGEEVDGKRPWQSNAERDCHSLFRRMGLSLNLRIRKITFSVGEKDNVDCHYIRLTDWLRYLLRNAPSLLAGADHESLESQCGAFWRMYRFQHPSHEIFQHPERLQATLPLLLFGDEGKGPKRGNYMITTFESAIGTYEAAPVTCDCCEAVGRYTTVDLPDCQGDPENCAETAVASKAATTLKTHSFLNKHILFGLSDVIYKEHPDVCPRMLDMYAIEARRLFQTGMLVNGKRHFVALIGCKGDMKHHAEKVANLTRSYAHMGRVNARAMCSLCHAGLPGLDWEDISDTPAWLPTMHATRPWEVKPSLCKAPFDASCPELFFRLDVFHVVKVGICRDLAGGIVLLCRLGFYDSPGDRVNLAARLKRAHGSFKLWLLAVRKSAALRYFSPSLFNVKKLADFPWSNTKGSDSVLLAQYLLWFASLELANPSESGRNHRTLLRLLQSTCRHLLAFLDVVYTHALWLDRVCAQNFYLHTRAFLAGYKALARHAIGLRMPAFALKPKFHALNHIMIDVQQALETKTPKILNPAAFCCDGNEDTVGRLCSLALAVSTRTIDVRVLQRHFLKTEAVMKRHLAARRKRGVRI